MEPIDGLITIHTAGQPVPIAAQGVIVATRIDFRAPTTNSGAIYIGSDKVNNPAGRGEELVAGSRFTIDQVVDLSRLYIDGTAGDEVAYFAIVQ